MNKGLKIAVDQLDDIMRRFSHMQNAYEILIVREMRDETLVDIVFISSAN